MTTRYAPARGPLFLLLLLPLQACTGATSAKDAFAPPADRRPTEVEVFNQRFEDLTVYLVRDDLFVRLGRVTGKTSRVLKVPRHHLLADTWVTLVAAHPDRVPHHASAEFQLIPGERAEWVIELYPGASPVIY